MTSRHPERRIVVCQHCGVRIKIPTRLIGQAIRCPECRELASAGDSQAASPIESSRQPAAGQVKSANPQKTAPDVHREPTASKRQSAPTLADVDPTKPAGKAPPARQDRAEPRGRRSVSDSMSSNPTASVSESPSEPAAPLTSAEGLSSPTVSRTPPPGLVACPYCHQWVLKKDLRQHRRQHGDTNTVDGWPAFPTLPPEDRYRGSLANHPQRYRHTRCGRETVVPEERIRTYLADPFFYINRSYCEGCRKSVPTGELVWLDTKTKVRDYFAKLKAQDPQSDRKKIRLAMRWLRAALAAGGGAAILFGSLGYAFQDLELAIFLACGSLLAAMIGVPALLIWRRGGV